MRLLRVLAIAACLSFGVASTASAAPMFMGLGDLGGTGQPLSVATGVSADGTVVIGASSSPNGREAFRWTLAGGIEGLGHLDTGSYDSRARDVSGDGSVIAGHSDNGSVHSEAFRWTESEAMTGLGYRSDCTEFEYCSMAGGVSRDGNVVVGFEDVGDSQRRAVAWFADGSKLTLGEGAAYAASADGSVIVGHDDTAPLNRPARWTAATGWVALSGRLGDGVATNVSSDGTFVVGYDYSPGAFLWEEGAGVTFFDNAHAWSVTDDGSIVVGYTMGSSPFRAFIWDAVNGMRDLQDVLVSDYGLDLTGWTLEFAYDISPNGRTIVGGGTNPSGDGEAWIATIPEPSTALLLAAGLAGLAGVGRRRSPRLHRRAWYAAVPLIALSIPSGAEAGPISVGGFNFAAGEAAFADNALLVSGSGVRFTCTAGGTAASSYAEALSGSDITQCVNVSGGGDGIIEVQFTDNVIQNGGGVDLIIFEVSGPRSPGTPDPAERFEVSIFDGSSFSSFGAFNPVATGFGTLDPTLKIFAVQIDLSAFGIATDGTVDRVRLHLSDNGMGSKGADIAALGALNSIPEPTTALLLACGLVGLAAIGRRRR